MNTAPSNPRIIYFITEDWFFCSHFLNRAVAARKAGYEVSVITRIGKDQDRIVAHGIRVHNLSLDRTGMNPWSELRTLAALVSILRREQPSVLHTIALKPIIYGALAAKCAGIRSVVSAPVGLGYVYSSRDSKARCLRPLISFFYTLAFRASKRVIFENPDDMASFVQSNRARALRSVLIRGAGVDLKQFYPVPETAGTPRIVLIGRMLRDKGVFEFVAAARALKNDGVAAGFVLVGDGDEGNPASIPEPVIQSWVKEKVIEWWGRREDIPAVIAGSHVVCLPSYREGLPKVLLEAAASGRAIVAADVPGCREVVEHGVNGLLVPARDHIALAAALRKLILSPALRSEMGRRGRLKAEHEFSTALIEQQTLEIYQEITRS